MPFCTGMCLYAPCSLSSAFTASFTRPSGVIDCVLLWVVGFEQSLQEGHINRLPVDKPCHRIGIRRGRPVVVELPINLGVEDDGDTRECIRQMKNPCLRVSILTSPPLGNVALEGGMVYRCANPGNAPVETAILQSSFEEGGGGVNPHAVRNVAEIDLRGPDDVLRVGWLRALTHVGISRRRCTTRSCR